MNVSIEPSTVEIIRNTLISIAMEMKVTIAKSAFSSTIQEAQDFSVALFEKDRLIAQGDTLAGHMASTPTRIKAILRKFSLNELQHGDVIIMNDPFWGGTHTPDVTTTKIIRVEELVFLPLTFGHWSDVGGMSPGSISGKATDPFQEGLLIPPIKLYEKGRLNGAVLDLMLNNVRLPELRAGDIRAQVAACDLAEERLDELIERFGAEIIKQSIEMILNATEERLRARIRAMPDGDYEYEDYLDSDGYEEKPIRIHVKVTVSGSNIKFDFAGSSKESIGPSNCGTANTFSAVHSMLKMMVDPYWVVNGGFYRPTEIVVPPGTCLNPSRRVPTGSCWEVTCRVRDVVLGALAGIVPRCFGGFGGSVNHTYIGGVHPKTARPYVWYEYPSGGFGGTPKADGCSSIQFSGDTRDYPIERAEAEFPLLCTLYQERLDSGGPGKFRGGLGLVRKMKILDDERYQSIGLSTIWDRTKIPCYGIGGGLSSCPGRVAILRSDNRLEYVPVELGSKCSLLPVHLNDTLICRTGGGGGYGDPLERDPELVLQDLQDLKVSELVAKEIYGVFIDKGRQAVDIDATKEQREKLKRAKIFCGVKKKDEEFIGNRRIVRLNPQLLNLLGYLPSESLPYLVELQGVSMAPLRLWTIEDEQYSHSEVGLDEASMRMLRINEGDRVWLRDPNWAERYVIATEEK